MTRIMRLNARLEQIRKQTWKECLQIELNMQSLEVVKSFCYLNKTIEPRGDAVDRVLMGIRNRCSKFWALLYLLNNVGLPLWVKGRSYFVCVCIFMPSGVRIEKEDVARQEERMPKLLDWSAMLNQWREYCRNLKKEYNSMLWGCVLRWKDDRHREKNGREFLAQ